MSGADTSIAPAEVAVERVFLSKNADSALKLGQARGAALAARAAGAAACTSTRRARSSWRWSGMGGAEKTQVAHMVKQLLRLEVRLAADAADALAVAHLPRACAAARACCDRCA